MSAGQMHGVGGHGTAESRRGVVECTFPGCEELAATSAGMCEHHRNVRVSGTGSWLEDR